MRFSRAALFLLLTFAMAACGTSSPLELESGVENPTRHAEGTTPSFGGGMMGSGN